MFLERRGQQKKMAKRPAPTALDAPSKRQKTLEAVFVRFQIVAGSYERLLYGLNVEYLADQLSLTPIFSFPAHGTCLKSVSASPPAPGSSKRWLVTGSTEDNVKVWDLRRRKEVGDLIVHQGAATQIKFIDPKLLLTASNDSTISLLRTKDWAVLRTLKGHKGRVNDVDLHPKGRIALSVGQDRTLRFWDIFGNTGSVTGKGGSSSTKLGQGLLF
jgi:protein MAK11